MHLFIRIKPNYIHVFSHNFLHFSEKHRGFAFIEFELAEVNITF